MKDGSISAASSSSTVWPAVSLASSSFAAVAFAAISPMLRLMLPGAPRDANVAMAGVGDAGGADKLTAVNLFPVSPVRTFLRATDGLRERGGKGVRIAGYQRGDCRTAPGCADQLLDLPVDSIQAVHRAVVSGRGK